MFVFLDFLKFGHTSPHQRRFFKETKDHVIFLESVCGSSLRTGIMCITAYIVEVALNIFKGLYIES